MRKAKTVTVEVVVILEGIPKDATVSLHCVGNSENWSTKAENQLQLISNSGSGHRFSGEIEIDARGEKRKFKMYGLTREQALAVYTHPWNRYFFGYRPGDKTYLTCFSYPHETYDKGVWWFVNYARYPIHRCGNYDENMFITPHS